MNMHGVDLHKSYATISVRNDSGKEVSFLPKVKDFAGYVEKLGPEDAVVLEASSGTFFWADRIESQGALCILIDAFRFRIIRDSWNKTDRRDGAPRRPPFSWVRDPPWQLPVQPRSEECTWWG
jgi:hypothetical protein